VDGGDRAGDGAAGIFVAAQQNWRGDGALKYAARMIASVKRLIERFTEQPGRLAVALRRAAYADGPMPDALRAWTEKVKQHPWKISDDDVAALKAAGFDEDQIYEATIAAAMGAAASRLAMALDLVKR
jgi:alkylhydroperoxidase family enzyme